MWFSNCVFRVLNGLESGSERVWMQDFSEQLVGNVNVESVSDDCNMLEKAWCSTGGGNLK